MAGLGPVDERGLLSELREGAEGIARLSENEESFRAAIDAFRALDGESLQALLERHGLLEYCRLICRWFCSKECVLLCLELCGPPRPEDEEAPDIREFANVVARVTADEELVELLATAIQERDPDAWRELIEKQELQRFCHLLCHWACAVRCRLICEVVCGQLPQKQPPHLIHELQAAGAAIGTLAADEKAFTAAVEAVRADNCELARGVLSDAGIGSFCGLVCEWFCSWRCVLVCLPLCRGSRFEPPESPIEEMLQFARAVGKLSEVPNALERLSAAVARQDTERFAALVKELGFERFCIQFCHWVCSLRCQALLRLRLPPANDRRLHEDRRPLLRHGSRQSRPRQRAHRGGRPGLLRHLASQRRPVRRRWRPPGRVPLRDGEHLRGRKHAGGRDADPGKLMGTGHAGADPRDQHRLVHPARPGPAVPRSDPGVGQQVRVGHLHDHPQRRRLDRSATDVPGRANGAGVRLAVRSWVRPDRAGHDHAQTLRRIESTRRASTRANQPKRRCRPTCTTGPHAHARSGRKRRRDRRWNLLAHRDQQHALQQHLPSPLLAGRPVRRHQRARGRLGRDRRARLETVLSAYRRSHGPVHGRALEPRRRQRGWKDPAARTRSNSTRPPPRTRARTGSAPRRPRWSARHPPQHGPSKRCRHAHTCSSCPSACC